MSALGEQVRGRPIAFFEPNAARLERLGEWFAAEGPSLLRFAYFVAGDRALAEDLVQDAFIRIYRAGGRVEHDGFQTYARRAVANLARSRFRRGLSERRAHSLLPRASESTTSVDVETRDEVWAVILTLSPQQRACAALKYYEHLSEKEIAYVLGISIGSVKKQLSRAIEKCRTALGDRRQP